jgi:xanthine dehydrogenase accessory factor
MHGYWEALQRLVNGTPGGGSAGRAAGEGEPFVSVTLVDVLASAPANVGAKMLVTRAGLYHGSVGGGKIEAKAIAEAVSMLNEPSGAGDARRPTRFVEWNLQRDVGMTCGGVVRLFFERYNVATWPIVIFGAGHCAQALVRVLLSLQCHITVIDPRDEWLSRLPQDAGAKLRAVKADRPPKEYIGDLPMNAFVVLMTMGHASDQPILAEILRTRGGVGGVPADRPAFPYVGVIGSEAKASALKRGLVGLGIPEEDATPGARYLCPIGLPIGTNDPAEIAISIAGQLLQVRDRGSPVHS